MVNSVNVDLLKAPSTSAWCAWLCLRAGQGATGHSVQPRQRVPALPGRLVHHGLLGEERSTSKSKNRRKKDSVSHKALWQPCGGSRATCLFFSSSTSNPPPFFFTLLRTFLFVLVALSGEEFVLVYYRGRNDAWDGYGGAASAAAQERCKSVKENSFFSSFFFGRVCWGISWEKSNTWGE